MTETLQHRYGESARASRIDSAWDFKGHISSPARVSPGRHDQVYRRRALAGAGNRSLPSFFGHLLEQGANPRDNKIHGDLIVAALWDNDISVSFRRLHELQMHWFHRSLILPNYRIDASPALFNITTEAPNEPFVGVGIDE